MMKLNSKRAVAATLALALCAGPVDASTPEAQQAYDKAFAAMMADVGNLDKTFAYANAAVAVEDFEGAVAALERMLLISPDLPRIKLELGVLYFRLGSFEMARTYLTEVRETPGTPSDVIARIDPFLAEIDKRVSLHKFSGSLFAGLRTDSNANSGVHSMTALGMTDLDPGTDGRPRSDNSAFVAATLDHSYDLQTQGGDTWDSTFLYYGNRYEDLDPLNINYINVTTGPRLALMPSVLEKASIRPYLIGTYITLGGDPYGYSPGVGVDLTSQVGVDATVNVVGETRRRHFHQSTERASAALQAGWESVLRGQLQKPITKNIMISGGASVGRTTAQRAYNSNTEVGLNAGVGIAYDSPLPGLDKPWMANLSLARTYSDYSGADPQVDPDSVRLDRDWKLTLTQAVPIDAQWTAVGTLGRTVRSSNLSNYAYDNSFFSLGAMWRF